MRRGVVGFGCFPYVIRFPPWGQTWHDMASLLIIQSKRGILNELTDVSGAMRSVEANEKHVCMYVYIYSPDMDIQKYTVTIKIIVNSAKISSPIGTISNSEVVDLQ